MKTELGISVLLAVIASIVGQNNQTNSTSNATETIQKNDTSSNYTDFATICNLTKTCSPAYNTNVSKYYDLRTRKCMCDEKCSTYGDCCEDSTYHKPTSSQTIRYKCRRTYFDGYIYMVDKCQSNYTNVTSIVENCESDDRDNLVKNFLSNIPVTNMEKNITYKNAFCAICNGEVKFRFWQTLLHCRLNVTVDIYTSNNTNSSLTDKNLYDIPKNWNLLLANLRVDESSGRAQLISVFNELSYACNIEGNMPSAVNPLVRFCSSNSTDRLCSDCENGDCIADLGIKGKDLYLVSNFHEPYLPKNNTCNDIPANVENKTPFCAPAPTPPPPPKPEADVESCFFYTSDNEPCVINTIYKLGEYSYGPNGTLRVGEFGDYLFPPNEYTNETTVLNAVYVCGAKENPRDLQSYSKIRDILSEILIKFSIFFLILYLITSASKQKLQSLPNKILFSFSITLLILYLDFEIAQLLESCKKAAVVFHYSILSCFAWLLIAAYDFWQVICRSSTKLQTLAGKTRLKRYFIYCFLAWICPVFIVSVSVYFELAVNRIIPCDLKPGYGRLKQCFIAQYKAKNYFFLYPAGVMFCAMIIFFAHTAYHIYLSKRKNIKSTAQNNYYILFLKLALTMGLTWTLGLLVTYTNLSIFKYIYAVLNASHGTLMYFVYGFKFTMLKKINETGKNSTIAQQTKSTFFSITDKIKSPKSKPSNSADLPTQELESTN